MLAQDTSQFPSGTTLSGIDVLKEMDCKVGDTLVDNSIALQDSYDFVCCDDKVIDAPDIIGNINVLSAPPSVRNLVVDDVAGEAVSLELLYLATQPPDLHDQKASGTIE